MEIPGAASPVPSAPASSLREVVNDRLLKRGRPLDRFTELRRSVVLPENDLAIIGHEIGVCMHRRETDDEVLAMIDREAVKAGRSVIVRCGV
jgi:hypothetical protein